MLCDILLVHKDVGNDIKQGKDEVRKPIQEKGIEITISLEITSKPISSVFGPASWISKISLIYFMAFLDELRAKGSWLVSKESFIDFG